METRSINILKYSIIMVVVWLMVEVGSAPYPSMIFIHTQRYIHKYELKIQQTITNTCTLDYSNENGMKI